MEEREINARIPGFSCLGRNYHLGASCTRPLDAKRCDLISLRARLLLLRLEKCQQTDTGNLDDLETNTGDITLGLTGTTEAGDEDLVVLVDKVETAVVGDEGGDLLAVLDELDTDTLSDSRVGLLGLNTDLLEDDTLGLRRATGGRGLVEVAEGTLLVLSVGLLVVVRGGKEREEGGKGANVSRCCRGMWRDRFGGELGPRDGPQWKGRIVWQSP